MAPSRTLDAAANDGGTTTGTPGRTGPGDAPGGFSGSDLGHGRPSPETLGAERPAGVAGARECGAQIVGRLAAQWYDGSAYDGDLWLDVLEHRALRMRSLGGSALDGDRSARLSALELRLQANDGGGARRFTRFFCRRVTQLGSVRTSAMRPVDVMLVDISAGGAKLEQLGPDGAAFCEGAEVELPSRIVWVRGTAFGIMFAGAPRKEWSPT